MRWRHTARALVWVMAAAMASGCHLLPGALQFVDSQDDAANAADAGTVDSAAVDRVGIELGLPDMAESDGGAGDAVPRDSGPGDLFAVDTAAADMASGDAALLDSAPGDVGQSDMQQLDSAIIDAVMRDLPLRDTTGAEVCRPDCDGRCGGADDGCGGQCQGCPGAQWCNAEACEPCTVDEHCGQQCTDCTTQVLDKVCVGSDVATAHCGCTSAVDDCAPGQTCPGDRCQGNFDQCALGLDDCNRCSEDCTDATDVDTTTYGWRWSCACIEDDFFGDPQHGCALTRQLTGYDSISLAPRAEPYNLSQEIFDERRICPDGAAFSVIELSGSTARLSPTPDPCCFYHDDDVLLINLQGSSSSVANVGNWEKLYVISFVGNRISFGGKSLFYGENENDDSNIGTGPDQQRVMLVRLPFFNSITVQTRATLTADGWNGLRGGVLAINGNTVRLWGRVDMAGKGFAGGAPTCGESGSDRAQPGESIAGTGVIAGGDPLYWQAAASYNYGGGGGGCYSGGVEALGGGRGGYGTVGDPMSCLVGCTEACHWPAAGGLAYGEQNLLNHMFLGSGGGGGGGFEGMCNATAGGAGGGIVVVYSLAELGISSMSADGAAAEPGSEPGGAGSGGSIYLWANSDAALGDKMVTALGGLAAVGGATDGAGRIMIEHDVGYPPSGETDPEAYTRTWY